MRDEFEIEDEWVPFETHSTLPTTGIPWSTYFKGMDSAGFFAGLDERGQQIGDGRGVRFNHQPDMFNTHAALLGGEFAREAGKGHEYHDAVFKAYFTELRNIADTAVLREIAESVGLDADAFEAATTDGRFEKTMERTRDDARAHGVTAAPTFIIEGYGKLTGAQPEATFRAAFAEAMRTKL